MRLAVISDVHGNLVALEVVLAHLASQAADLVVNLGDCATSPLWPRETCELLADLRLPTVRGNHDRWIAAAPGASEAPSVAFTRRSLSAAQRTELGALPATLEVTDGVLAVHGTPASDTEYLLEEAVDGRLRRVDAATLDRRLRGVEQALVLCGHSHQQHAAVGGGRLVLNPGSVGCPRYADDGPGAVAEAGSPHARYAVATRRAGRWDVEMQALSYDWSAVAERARRNGRADWAAGFLRGA